MKHKLKLIATRGLVLTFGFILNLLALKSILIHFGIEPLNLILIIWSLFPLYNVLDLGSSIHIMNNLDSTKSVFIRTVSKSLQIIFIASLFSLLFGLLGVQLLNSQNFDFGMGINLYIIVLALWLHGTISVLNTFSRTLNALNEVIWSTLLSSLLGPLTSILTISFALFHLKFEFLLFCGALAGLALSAFALYFLAKHLDLKSLRLNLLVFSNIKTNINLAFFGLNSLVLINSVLPRLVLIKSFSAEQAVVGVILFQVLSSSVSLGASAGSQIWRKIILLRDKPSEVLDYVNHETKRMQKVAFATSGLALAASLASFRFLGFEVTTLVVFILFIVTFVGFVGTRNQAYGAYSSDTRGIVFQIKLQSSATTIFCLLLFTGTYLNFLMYFMIWATVSVALIQLPLWLRFRVLRSRL
jgi:hypothetical protein